MLLESPDDKMNTLLQAQKRTKINNPSQHTPDDTTTNQMRRSVGRISAGGPLYLALPGSNQHDSKPLLIQSDRYSDTVLSHNSRLGKLKSHEEKEKVLSELKADQRFNAVFMKIWRVAVQEDVSIEDLSTI